MTSPQIKSQSNRPQDRHQNAQTQQTESTELPRREAPAIPKLAEPDSSIEEKSPIEWAANERNEELGEDGQYEANRDSKYGRDGHSLAET